MSENTEFGGVRVKRVATGIGVALCGLLTFGSAERGGQPRFSERSVAGAYSYVGNGGLLVPPAAPEPTPAATLGIFTFDGGGGCSARGFVNVLGTTVETTTLSCSYSVEPDGFGEVEATFTNAPLDEPFPFRFVIGDGGRTLSLMNTAFVVGTLSATRM